MEYDDFVKGLKCLDQEQLRKLRNHITSLLVMSGEQPSSPSLQRPVNDGWGFLQTVYHYSVGKGIEMPPPSNLARSSLLSGLNLDKVRIVEKWVAAVGTKQEQRALLLVGVDLLWRYLKKGVPMFYDDDEKRLVTTARAPTYRELIIYADLIPWLVENEFPGYQKAGVLRFIVAQTGDSNVR